MSKRLFDGATKQMDFAAGADFIGTGAIHVPVWDTNILDMTRKRGTLLQRVRTKQATGHPTRYFEKLAHDSKHQFIDPRKINHNLDTEVQRVGRSAYIKAMVDGITFGLFDKEVYYNAQGARFGDLQTQDLQEVISDMLDAQDRAVWTGTAKDLMDDTNPEYCSVLTQVKKHIPIAKGARLTTAIIGGVAQLMYNKQYRVQPTAIYMNPLDKALLDEQEMAESLRDKIKVYDVEVVAGLKCPAIMTAAGILPIITDVYCPVGKILIANEDMFERQYVTTDAPRLFQMGTEKDLNMRYIAILFDVFIVKGGDYGHMVMEIEGRTEETATEAQKAAAGNAQG